jgi:hypothetical protein
MPPEICSAMRDRWKYETGQRKVTGVIYKQRQQGRANRQ